MQNQNVEFTSEELETLREVLHHHVMDMDIEVGRTDTASFKQMLKHRRAVLENALAKLEHQPAHS